MGLGRALRLLGGCVVTLVCVEHESYDTKVVVKRLLVSNPIALTNAAFWISVTATKASAEKWRIYRPWNGDIG